MIAGFTGSRKGMTEEQKSRLQQLLSMLKIKEFHHGDCVGADETAHNVVREVLPECPVVVHPPDIKKLRAFCKGDSEKFPLPYQERNQHIVDASDVLLATPDNFDFEEDASGTASTVRKARKAKVTVYAILPNGVLKTI